MWHRVLGAGQSNADRCRIADVETCLSVSWMGFGKVKIKKLNLKEKENVHTVPNSFLN